MENEMVILGNEKVEITSLDVAKITGKKHYHVLEKAKITMKELGVKGKSNFRLSSYKTRQNKEVTMIIFSKRGAIQFMASYNALLMDELMDYIEELENQLNNLSIPSYQIENRVERAKKWIKEEEERQFLSEENTAKQEVIETQVVEIEHKEDVIIGLTDNIDLATKRQRITQIIRYGANGRYSERYNLLYSEFEKKYHIDLKRRLESKAVKELKPKVNSKMKYIDNVLNKIPELYEIRCKIFETDVNKLKQHWDDVIRRES